MVLILFLTLFCLPFVVHAQNVGVGTDAPVEFFSVGASSQFRVNASGNVVRINDIQYNFPASQGGINTYLRNDGSGNLSWQTLSITTGNISATGTANNTTFLRGDGAWTAPAGGGGAVIVATTTLSQTVVGNANYNGGNTGTQVFSHTVGTTGTYSLSGFAGVNRPGNNAGNIAGISIVVKRNGTVVFVTTSSNGFDNFIGTSINPIFSATSGDVITAFVAFYADTDTILGIMNLTKL